MTETSRTPVVRAIACSFGCGNDSNFVLVDIASSDTSFLCVPCFLHVAENMTRAMLDPDNAMVRLAIAESPLPEQAPLYPVSDIQRTPESLARKSNGLCADCGSPDDAPHEAGCIFGG
jgi:hypothetical protein